MKGNRLLLKLSLCFVILFGSLIVSPNSYAWYQIYMWTQPRYISVGPGAGSSSQITVMVFDENGNGVSDVTVYFSIDSGSGFLNPTSYYVTGTFAYTTFGADSTPQQVVIRCMVGSSSAYTTITVVRATLQSIEFTSDHQVDGHNMLINNIADWTDSGTPYTEPEWIRATSNNPISQTKSTTLTLIPTIKVEPSSVNFRLEGNSYSYPIYFALFHDDNIYTSTSSDQTLLPMSGYEPLPNKVATLYSYIGWTTHFPDYPWISGSAGAGNFTQTIYVTYGTPITTNQEGEPNLLTRYRLSACVNKANGTSTPDGAAVPIQHWLATAGIDNTGINVGDGDDYWLLLSGSPYKGQCAEQAILMSMALRLLGIEGVYQHVYGSKQIDPDCLLPDNRYCLNDAYNEYLYLYFASTGYNQGEGTCTVGGINGTYYAVWPEVTGYTSGSIRGDLDMLRKLDCIQVWWVADIFKYPIRECAYDKYEIKP